MTVASVNPKSLKWDNPTQYVDGTPYGQADNAGYVVKIDTIEAVAIPLAWGTEYDLTTLEVYKGLKRGTHTVALAVVSKEGEQSDFSAPVNFSVVVRPFAPANLVLA